MLGSTFAPGATQVVRDLGDTPEYIRAVPDVVAEICVPLRLGGRVAGALNVECKRRSTTRTWRGSRRRARVFEDVVRDLGGVPVEEPAELLARLGYELATIADGQELARHTLTAALTVSGMSSAALIPGDGSRPPVLAEGPLAPLLLDLPVPDARQLVEYVARATSSWAIGLEEGDGFEATRALRARGVSSLVVLAMVAKGRREGVLVLVDQHPQPGLDRVIPLLEMLAATAAAMLAAASASAALQLSERELAHQATHDPLTGLANRTRLLEEITTQLADRRGRARLVVLFVDLDGFKEVNDRHGHRAGDRLLVAVADRLRHAARGSDLVARLGGDEFVVLCPGVESVGEATAVGDRVLERLAAPVGLGDVDGLGWLGGRFGLACDNLVAAEVVTAGGDVRTVDAETYPDLLWGLRGGGGTSASSPRSPTPCTPWARCWRAVSSTPGRPRRTCCGSTTSSSRPRPTSWPPPSRSSATPTRAPWSRSACAGRAIPRTASGSSRRCGRSVRRWRTR